jgi:hypothetical protein
MVAQLISVRPTNGWSLGDEVTRRDIEILRHCEEVVRTFDVEAPAGQSPIQLGTLSPVASHELFASAISIEGCSKD